MGDKLMRRDFIKMAGIGAAGATVAAGMAASGTQVASAEESEDALKVKVAFFSPTGGTRNSAIALAESITDEPEYVDLTSRDVRAEQVDFASDELAIVAAPSMGGQLPLVDGLLTNLKGDNTPAVVLAAYGNRNYDDLLAQMKGILSEQGFVVIAGIALVTPHVFSDKAGRSRPNGDDREVIKQFAADVVAKVRAGDPQEVELPGNPKPEPKELSVAIKMYNPDNCVHCLMCATNCPVGAINPDDVSQIDEDLCISCQRCLYSCNYYARNYDVSPVREFIETHCLEYRPVESFI